MTTYVIMKKMSVLKAINNFHEAEIKARRELWLLLANRQFKKTKLYINSGKKNRRFA